jgi:hypothetical protein
VENGLKNKGYRGSMIDEPVAHCIRKTKSGLTVAGRNPRMVLQNGMLRILRETRKCRIHRVVSCAFSLA